MTGLRRTPVYRTPTNTVNSRLSDTVTVDVSAASAGTTVVDASLVTTAANSVSVLGGSGTDSITGGAGDDTLIGGEGSNTIDISDGGADSAFGGSGADLFISTDAAFDGSDTISGGGGTDTIRITGSTISAADLANKTGIEVLELLGAGPHNVTLTDAFVGASDADTVTVDVSTATAGTTV